MYVIVVPLLLHSGAAGWLLTVTVVIGAVAALAVLAALWQSSRALAETQDSLTRTRNSLTRAQRALGESERQAGEIVALQNQASSLRLEISSLESEITDARKREQYLRDESAGLREGADKRLEAQSQAVNDAVRHALDERLPPAIRGKTPPPGATGIDSELAGLLDEAVQFAVDSADAQQSMRTAVVAMSRRVQASAHRIQEEAALVADRHPGNADVLEVSMRVDHAAAQQARTAQSMAVLLGEWPGQQWPDPLPLVDVVRAASGRIIAYRRIEVAGDQEIAAAAPAVEPLIHLVAELLANATQSSPPTTQVPVTIRAVQRGAVIEVHDCGVGLDDYRLDQARAIATGKRPVGLESLGEFPQTGLAVVGQYARRHGFRVDISESVYGGVRAIVGVPIELTESVESTAPAQAPAPPAPAAPAPASDPARAPADTLTAPAGGVPAPADPVPGEAAAPGLAYAETGTVPDAGPAAGSGTADEPLVTRRSGLPRRVSPRHDADADAGWRASRNTGPIEVAKQPTPEEAGAWMGAFLTSPGDPQPGDPGIVPPYHDSIASEGNSETSEDNSTGQQEQR